MTQKWSAIFFVKIRRMSSAGIHTLGKNAAILKEKKKKNEIKLELIRTFSSIEIKEHVSPPFVQSLIEKKNENCFVVLMLSPLIKDVACEHTSFQRYFMQIMDQREK